MSDSEREYICTECGEPFELCRACEAILPHTCGESWGDVCYDCADAKARREGTEHLPALPYPRAT